FATKIYTPSCYRIDLGKKHIRFEGYMELSYLHPNYFLPNKEVLSILGIPEGIKYAILRFVSWGAVHDFGHKGMSLENKRKAVMEISKYAKVFISAEGELPDDLESFRIKVPFEMIHDVLYYSSLIFGESGTMTSEAAVLGIPAVFLNNSGLGYTEEEEERYGIVYNFSESEEDQQAAIRKAVQILQNPYASSEYRFKRERLLADKIDTTAFMVN